mmetsp:Transcript_5030/g.13917  ORF Transcript_5030/g.13917 Transcript_5030/m.13917 type:complete len:411 (-) Transcript_5030:62-1294(-)
MGQTIQPPTNFVVSVFEPALVSKVRGEVYVVLRAVVGETVVEELVDSFPAVRGFPMRYVNGVFHPKILEVEVVLANSVQTFRAGGGERPYRTLPIPLQYFSNVWLPESAKPTADGPFHAQGTACLWLGLTEAVTPDNGDVLLQFELSRSAGARLTVPKILVALHSSGIESDELPLSSVGNYACVPEQRGKGTVEEITTARMRVRAEHQFLGIVDSQLRGLHRVVDEARKLLPDHDALQAANAELRAAIAKRGRWEGNVISDFGTNRLAASCLSVGTDSILNPMEELAEVQHESRLLEEMLVEQQHLEEEYSRKTLAAEQATSEIVKLCEDQEKEMEALQALHAEGAENLRRLWGKYEHVRFLSSRGSPSMSCAKNSLSSSALEGRDGPTSSHEVGLSASVLDHVQLRTDS